MISVNVEQVRWLWPGSTIQRQGRLVSSRAWPQLFPRFRSGRNSLLESISATLSKQLLRLILFAKRLQSQSVFREKLNKSAAGKLLMKLTPGLPNSPGRSEKNVRWIKIPADNDCKTAIIKWAPSPEDVPIPSPSRIPAGRNPIRMRRKIAARLKLMLIGSSHEFRAVSEIAMASRIPWIKIPRKRDIATSFLY